MLWRGTNVSDRGVLTSRGGAKAECSPHAAQTLQRSRHVRQHKCVTRDSAGAGVNGASSDPALRASDTMSRAGPNCLSPNRDTEFRVLSRENTLFEATRRRKSLPVWLPIPFSSARS